MNIIKQELRQKYRAKRDSFGEEFIKNASGSACELLLQAQAFKDADVLLLYYPIKNEISPLPLIELAKKSGKKIAFPICNTNTNTLTFKIVTSESEFIPSRFGIFEPLLSSESPILSERTIALVPAIAFSRDGHRLGYGKGYYDRFLSDFRGTSIGFSYSELVLDSLPTLAHDIPLKMIVTESEVLYFD